MFRLGLVLGALLAFGDSQKLPDFSGDWRMDATRSESARQSSGDGIVALHIRQSPSELRIESKRGSESETIVYRLDGSESERPAKDNGAFQWKARWSGPKLQLETHRNINRATVTVQETLSIDNKANELTVDRTVMVQHGYTMRGTRNYSSGTDIFVRSR